MVVVIAVAEAMAMAMEQLQVIVFQGSHPIPLIQTLVDMSHSECSNIYTVTQKRVHMFYKVRKIDPYLHTYSMNLDDLNCDGKVCITAF